MSHKQSFQKRFSAYLDNVEDFHLAEGSQTTCRRCPLSDGLGWCKLLHDPVIPNDDCLGLVERDGIKQP